MGVNFLILDEPTNHLDLWARDALEQALLQFEGTVIVVSHDRYLLNHVVDQLIVLEGDGRCQLIHGNYDTYEMMRAQQEAARGQQKTKPQEAYDSARQLTPVKQKRRRRFPYRKVAELEVEIAAEEAKIRDLESLMASPDLYRDGERVQATTHSFEEAKIRLAQLYERWEEAVELN